MEWADTIIEALSDADVDTVAHVPDSAVAPLVERAESAASIDAIRATREEEAFAIVSGAWLADRRGAVICQSSGLANSLNVLSSLNKAARIPLVGFITRRGGPGEFNYAQVPFGYNMPRALDDLGLRHESVGDDADLDRTVTWGVETAFDTGEPYFLLLEPSLVGVKDV